MEVLLTRFTVVFIEILLGVLLVRPQIAHSQVINTDTLFIYDSPHNYFHQDICLERKKLDQLIVNDDTSALRKAIRTLTANIFHGEIWNVNRLLTTGETHLLSFVFGDFKLILNDIQNDKDFFNVDVIEALQSPSLECGVIGLDHLKKWQEASDRVMYNIQYAVLTPSEKDLLTFYWQAILFAIEQNLPALNKLALEANRILQAYPDCGCEKFLARTASIKFKKQYKFKYSLEVSLANLAVNGPINQYLNRQKLIGGSIELGFSYKRWGLFEASP